MVIGNAEDIYELLEISPDASGALAREMYWEKMRGLTEAGSSRNAYAVEALNRALAIVLDENLRREYDASRPSKRERTAAEARAEAEESAADGTKGHATERGGLGVYAVVAGLTLVLSFVAWQSFGVLPGLLVLPIGLMVVVMARSLMDQAPPHPAYAVLHLRRDASREHIEIAYRVRAQQILLQVRYNPKAIAELDELDRAYVSAMTIAYRADAEGAKRVVPGISPASPIGRWAASMAAFALELAYALLVRAGSTALRGANEMRSAAGREIAARTEALGAAAPVSAARPGAAATAMLAGADASAAPRSASALASEQPEIDLQQRLSAGLKSNAAQVARAAQPLAESEPAVAPPALAYLLLESAMGTRRLPMGDKPVSIGSSPSCDVVLPEREDVALEHALVWQHGSRVILHAGLSAVCYVNGSPVTWGLLDDGDELKIAGYTLRVSIPAA